jgi:hypothetical protein
MKNLDFLGFLSVKMKFRFWSDDCSDFDSKAAEELRKEWREIVEPVEVKIRVVDGCLGRD